MDFVRKAPEFLTLAQRYGVNVENVVEALRQPMYDTVDYAAAGQTNLTLFALPIGQGGKTSEQTNMTVAGQLPAPQNFLVTSIHLDFTPNSSITPAGALLEGGQYIDDVYSFGRAGYLELQVGSKIQLTDGPMRAFPPRTRLDTMVSTTVAGTSHGYAQWQGLVYDITPILIPWGQNFSVALRWNTAVALPSTLAGTVRCTLDGYLYRLAQ